jgi:rfaE bifunctional protein nucleotidyltransferase chain/domain
MLDYTSILSEKLKTENELMKWLNIARLKNEKIVFTNGCFDMLHAGHVDYLNKAASLGNRLIIGLNADSSVSKLKGPKRPINTENFRALVLSALHVVDAIVIFDEETPEKLIKLIKPDVLVKGADYTIEQIVGADFVLKSGGNVELIPFLEGFSTTTLIQKMRD